jgi:hypothetical protein
MTRPLCLLFITWSMGCGGAVSSGLGDAHDARRAPPDLVVIYDEYEERWGGERIEVRGDGTLAMRRWQPWEAREEGSESNARVSPDAVQRLVSLLVEIEAWDQETEREARLDDARARVEIELGGERTEIWEWSADLEATQRVVLVKRLLERLAEDAVANDEPPPEDERPELVDHGDAPPAGDEVSPEP